MKDEALLNYLRGIVEDISKRIEAKDLSRDEEVELLKTEVRKLLQRFDVVVEELLPPILVQEYFGGMDEAARALIDEGIDVASGLALGAGGIVAQEFRQPVYLDALQNIIEDSFIDLKAATRMAEETGIETIEQTIAAVKGEIAKGTIQGEPRKVIQQSVMTAFRNGGMTAFLTSDGKRLPLDFYAMTVTRYKTREAGVTGSVTRYREYNQDLVQIIERSTTCAICGMYKGMVVSLDGKTPGYPVVGENGIKLPPYHPNCRGTTRVFVVSRKTPEEIAEAKGRNDKYEPPKDNRTPAQKAAYEKEQEKRRQANEEKKQFMRWNDVLGADNFKTLGAFRKAKRENSPKFQELQSAYRSKMQTKV